MDFYRDEWVVIRAMEEGDIYVMEEGFSQQGWHKPAALFASYNREQREGTRLVFTAFVRGAFAGYATLRKSAVSGPFAGKGIPEICDFNVLALYQRRGVGSLLMDTAERIASSFSGLVSLGVGLHAGYGPAQRMYVKRGYIPDGSGAWFGGHPLAPYAQCKNDDDLVLYLSKKLALAGRQDGECLL